MKCRLRTPDGLYVSSDVGGEDYFNIHVRDNNPDGGMELHLRTVIEGRDGHRLADHHLINSGEALAISTPYLRIPSAVRFLRNLASAEVKLDAEFETSSRYEFHHEAGDGWLRDGDRIRIRRSTSGSNPTWMRIDNGVLKTDVAQDRAQIFVIEMRKNLVLYYSNAHTDHVLATNTAEMTRATNMGYHRARVQGSLWLSKQPETELLKLFYNESIHDHVVTKAAELERELLATGYVFVAELGYVQARPEIGTVPLKRYHHNGRQDHMIVARQEDERAAGGAGYRFAGFEGHLFPVIEALDNATGLVDPGLGSIIGGGLIGGSPIQPPMIHLPLGNRRRGENKVAWVFSGGGAKGCFEAGAAQRLWNQGERPDIICGVSVGALNGAKLAQGTERAADDLVQLWRNITDRATPQYRVFNKDFYSDLIFNWIGHSAKALEGNLVERVISSWFMPIFYAPGAFAGFGLDQTLDKMLYALMHLHALHRMEPLRRMIQRELEPALIKLSNIDLRVGIVDARSGQYFSVTGPERDWPNNMAEYGLLEVESDHQIGETWLSRPLFGAEHYGMPLWQAIYASSTLPVFMDPYQIDLREAVVRDVHDYKVTMLRAQLPPAVRRIAEIVGNSIPDVENFGTVEALLRRIGANEYAYRELEAEDIGRLDTTRQLFDGGLRDTLPIRTAMRLGARDIVVFTGDRLQRANWSYSNNFNDLFNIPAAQYLFNLLNIWFNDSARNDVMAAVSQNEFLGWLYRAFSKLNPDDRQQLVNEFNSYWAQKGLTLEEALGASSILGGELGYRANPVLNDARRASIYGMPFADEGCRIRYIAPSEDLLDPLAFEDANGIAHGLRLGAAAAEAPVELSFPVPDELLRST